MRIGLLRNRVLILDGPSTAQDSVGQPLPGQGLLATRWARVEPISGREYFAAQGVVAGVTTRITMRYLSWLEPTMVIGFGGVIYDIKDVIDLELKHITHVLMCSSGLIPDG